MRIVQVQFVSWDKTYNFTDNGLELNAGDKVIVKTELGTEIGEVVGFAASDDVEAEAAVAGTVDSSGTDATAADETAPADKNTESPEASREIKPIIRIATAHDLEKVISPEERKKALDYCKQMKEKFNLPMKFIEAHFSFDGSRITFAFIADGRVDFRELVKDLTRHFGRTIRLQQIGIRDEAKVMGDYGHCGQKLCCKRFLRELTSITSEMAELQQCSHRGSERISGICGRLMCCLAYEEKGYEVLAERLAPVGAKVSVDGKKGIVVKHHVLKQSVDVEFGGENGEAAAIVEVDLNRHKKK